MQKTGCIGGRANIASNCGRRGGATAQITTAKKVLRCNGQNLSKQLFPFYTVQMYTSGMLNIVGASLSKQINYA